MVALTGGFSHRASVRYAQHWIFENTKSKNHKLDVIGTTSHIHVTNVLLEHLIFHTN